MNMHGVQDGGTSNHHGKGSVAAGFWGDCLMFTIGSTLTIAIATMDIISDWFMYRTITDLDLPGKVEKVMSKSNSSVSDDLMWRADNFYMQLPTIFQAILILATIVYSFYFIWFCYMFRAERKHLKNKWDGLPFKGSIIEKYGSEIFICIHVIFEDLPVAGLLFAVQLAVSCQVVIHLDNMIFVLALSTTFISLVWKLVCLLWNSGCFGQRDECHSGYTICILRCISLLFLVCAFIFVIWNIILLKGSTGVRYQGKTLQNFIMDKIGVDRWTSDDKIVIALSEDSEDLLNTIQNQDKMNQFVINVAPLNQILERRKEKILIQIPCQNDSAYSTMTSFFKELPYSGNSYANCTIMFAFSPSIETMEINYDYRYYYYNESGVCLSGNFKPQLPLPEQGEANSQVAMDTHNGLVNTESTTTQLYHTLMLMSQSWSHSTFACAYRLVQNTTLLSSHICQ